MQPNPEQQPPPQTDQPAMPPNPLEAPGANPASPVQPLYGAPAYPPSIPSSPGYTLPPSAPSSGYPPSPYAPPAGYPQPQTGGSPPGYPPQPNMPPPGYSVSPMPPSGYPPPPQQSGALPPGYVPPTGAPPAGYPSPSGMPPTGGYPAPTGAPSMQPYGYPGYPVPARPANTNTTLIVVLSVIAAVVVIGAGIGIISAFTSTHSSVSGASQHYKVGDHVAIGNTWVITVNGATESMGNQFDQQQLQAGDTYVIVDVTVKNASSQTQDLLGYIDFAVKDSTGEEHQQTFFSSESVPDGNISPGDILRGQIAFEVPANDHHLEFLYTDDSFGSTPVIWDITV